MLLQVSASRMLCCWQKSTQDLFQSGCLECRSYILSVFIWEKGSFYLVFCVLKLILINVKLLYVFTSVH